jgi:hypothetical protein
MTPYELPEALETWLQNHTKLSYIDTVDILLYPEDSLPAFQDYCICISPSNFHQALIANRTNQITIGIDIVCIVRNFHARTSIIGTAGQPGIMKMIEDVKLSLFQYGESTRELDIRYDETSKPVQFKNTKFKEREGFFREHILPYEVRLYPKNF